MVPNRNGDPPGQNKNSGAALRGLLYSWMDGGRGLPRVSDRYFSAACAGFGDVIMGTRNAFRYVGINRTQCGFEENARVLRTIGGAYRTAGYVIAGDPVGGRHPRTMEATNGAVSTIATDGQTGFCSRKSHIPFPNTPVVQGVGSKWHSAQQGDNLTTLPRALVIGWDYSIAQIQDLPRETAEYRIVSTPPFVCTASPYGAHVNIL